MSVHLIRITWQQAGFDTPNVGHFAVLARDPSAAIAGVCSHYRGYPLHVEYVTTFTR